MALPKKKMSRARRHKRRGCLKIKTPLLTLCAKCRKAIPSHIACPFCGTYKGRMILDLEKRAKRKREKKKKEQN
ncbi:MAG: 50S ribosomal protein L32 [bacterium]|nr:50S ribosomal protein L32 [bacterium]